MRARSVTEGGGRPSDAGGAAGGGAWGGQGGAPAAPQRAPVASLRAEGPRNLMAGRHHMRGATGGRRRGAGLALVRAQVRALGAARPLSSRPGSLPLLYTLSFLYLYALSQSPLLVLFSMVFISLFVLCWFSVGMVCALSVLVWCLGK